MATNNDFEIKGLDKIKKMLHGMPERMNRNFIEKTFRKSGRPLIKKAKALAPIRKSDHENKGNLKRSIGAFPSKSSDRKKNFKAGIWIGPRSKKNTENKNFKGFHAHLVEFGTKERKLKKPRIVIFIYNGRTVYARLTRTGKMPARPFMRPAYQQTKGQMEVVMNKEFSKALTDHFKKNGGKVK